MITGSQYGERALVPTIFSAGMIASTDSHLGGLSRLAMSLDRRGQERRNKGHGHAGQDMDR